MEFNQINLTTHDHMDRRILYGVLGGVAVLVAVFTLFNLVGGIQAFRERASYRSKIRDLQQQAQALTAQQQNNTAFDAQAAADLQKSTRHANYLIALDIFPWTGILDELEKTIPPQVVLDRFLPSKDLKTIRITGHTPTVDPITRFQDALGKSDLFQSVVLENMDFGSDESAKKTSADKGAVQFEMICGLNLKAVFPEESFGGLWMTLASQAHGNTR